MNADLEKEGLSVIEFSALFGKHKSWGYRMIHKEKVKVIPDIGDYRIPASEVDRLVGSATTIRNLEKIRSSQAKEKTTRRALPRVLINKKAALLPCLV